MPASKWDSYTPTLYKILETFGPRLILEWGPGHSTDIMANFRGVEKVISLEHDRDYYDKMKTRSYPELMLILEENIERYVDYPVRENIHPDLIFVDGRHRANCLKVAREILNPGGVVILHDSDRDKYREGTDRFPFQIFTDEGNTLTMTITRTAHFMAEQALKGLMKG